MTTLTPARIGKVTLKNNKKSFNVIPSCQHAVLKTDFGWGEVSFRVYDGSQIDLRTALWMIKQAERKLLIGAVD